MAISNFLDLKTDFAKLAKRNDTANYIAELITLVEARLQNDLRVQTMEKHYDLWCLAEWSDFPADTLEPVQIYNDKESGFTQFTSYKIVGLEIRVEPEASLTSPIKVLFHYYARPTALVDDTDTNTTLVAHPNVYLAALLLEYAIFKEDDVLINTRTLYYQDAIAQANGASGLVKYPGGSLQIRSV